MQCVILAGGLGTRLRPFTDTAPKALVPVAGKPFTAWQLDWISRQGVEEVIYSIGYRGSMIRDYVGDGSAWGLRARYVEDGATPVGTGGGLRRALDEGVLEKSFFVQYGDSFLPFSYGRLWKAFQQDPRPAMMAVFRNEGRWVPGNVRFEQANLIRYDKKATPGSMPFLDYGITAMDRDLVEQLMPPDEFCDLSDVYRTLSEEDMLAGYEVEQRFYEVGSPQGISDLEHWLETAPL